MEDKKNTTPEVKGRLAILSLGVIVILYAIAWFVLMFFMRVEPILFYFAVPVFIFHATLGVGLIRGWNWARFMVISIASLGILISIALWVFLGQGGAFVVFLLALFLAALVILLSPSSSTYFAGNGAHKPTTAIDPE